MGVQIGIGAIAKAVYERNRIHTNIFEMNIQNINDAAESIKALQQIDSYKWAYDVYVNTVSQADMATSFEQCCLLAYIIQNYPLKRILDTGSGIATYFIRHAVQSHPIEVVTFETDASWLEKTKKYLAQHQLSDENMFLWDDVKDKDLGTFDLIYHDLGGLELRQVVLDNIAQRTSENGILIADDIHYDYPPDYAIRSGFQKYFAERKWTEVDIKELSMDRFTRYAGLFINNGRVL